jgi:hypothetical protein
VYRSLARARPCLVGSFVVYLIVHAFPVRVRGMAQRHMT